MFGKSLVFQKGCFWAAFFLLFSQTIVSSQETRVFRFYPGKEFNLTEKQDLRKRVNGRYQGLVYRESRGSFTQATESAGINQYRGTVYVFEEMKRDTVLAARRLNASYSCRLDIQTDGEYLRRGEIYPALRSVPRFPAGPLSPGDRWQAEGEKTLFFDSGSLPTVTDIFCDYRYEGVRGSGEGAYYLITCQYALRYRYQDIPDEEEAFVLDEDFAAALGRSARQTPPPADPRLASANGSHKLEIRIPLDRQGEVFMRDILEEQYLLHDGTRIEYSGFVLTWFDMPVETVTPEKRRQILQAAETWEKNKPEAGGSIEVTQSDEGLLLTLPDLHFVPDQAVVLPEERGRLDTLGGILKTIPEGLFLVRGHTADVGSPESQQKLSEERALEIIRQLKSRGFAEDRFLYEGKGGTMPLGDNATEEGRRLNRRVEIIILNQK